MKYKKAEVEIVRFQETEFMAWSAGRTECYNYKNCPHVSYVNPNEVCRSVFYCDDYWGWSLFGYFSCNGY